MSEEFSDGTAQDTTFSSSPEPASYEFGEPQQRYVEPPQSWRRDVAERHWNALPDDLRGYLHNRERDAGGKIAQQGHRLSELDGISQRYETINNVFQRYQPYVPEGIAPEHAIESLLQAHQMLSQPETRMEAVAQLVQSYGVDPMALLPTQYRDQFETAQRELLTTRQAEVQRTVDEFTRDKSYYAEIRQDVIREIVELRKAAPGLDNATVLRLAHDRVLDRTGLKSRLDIEAKAKEFEETQKAAAERAKVQREEQARMMKAAKRAAGINVKSTPVRAAPKTLDDDLREIAKRAYG